MKKDPAAAAAAEILWRRWFVEFLQLTCGMNSDVSMRSRYSIAIFTRESSKESESR